MQQMATTRNCACVHDVRMSTDNRRIVTGAHSSTVQVWERTEGDVTLALDAELRLAGPCVSVELVVNEPDQLYTCTAAGVVQLWNWSASTLRARINCPTARLVRMAPTSDLVAIALEDAVLLCQATTLDPRRRLLMRLPDGGLQRQLSRSLAWSSDSQLLVVCDGASFMLWSMEKLALTTEPSSPHLSLMHEHAACVAFLDTPTLSSVLCVGDAQRTFLWNWRAGQVIAKVELGPVRSLCASFVKENAYFATATADGNFHLHKIGL